MQLELFFHDLSLLIVFYNYLKLRTIAILMTGENNKPWYEFTTMKGFLKQTTVTAAPGFSVLFSDGGYRAAPSGKLLELHFSPSILPSIHTPLFLFRVTGLCWSLSQLPADERQAVASPLQHFPSFFSTSKCHNKKAHGTKMMLHYEGNCQMSGPLWYWIN